MYCILTNLTKILLLTRIRTLVHISTVCLLIILLIAYTYIYICMYTSGIADLPTPKQVQPLRMCD